MLENSLFGAIKLTKDADIDKYKYSEYWFDARGFFTFSDGSEIGKNLIILAVDMNSSVYNENKKKDILLLGKGSTQRSYDTTLNAEKKYSINFILSNK